MPDPPHRTSCSRGKGEKAVREAFFRHDAHPPFCYVRERRRIPDPDRENVASSPHFPYSDAARRSCSQPMSRTSPIAITRVTQNASPRRAMSSVGRASHLQIAARSDCAVPREKTTSGSDAVWRLACARLRCGDATRAANHAKSGSAHALDMLASPDAPDWRLADFIDISRGRASRDRGSVGRALQRATRPIVQRIRTRQS